MEVAATEPITAGKIDEALVRSATRWGARKSISLACIAAVTFIAVLTPASVAATGGQMGPHQPERVHLRSVTTPVLAREGLSLWRTREKPTVSRSFAVDVVHRTFPGRRVLQVLLARAIARKLSINGVSWIIAIAPRCRTTLVDVESARRPPLELETSSTFGGCPTRIHRHT